MPDAVVNGLCLLRLLTTTTAISAVTHIYSYNIFCYQILHSYSGMFKKKGLGKAQQALKRKSSDKDSSGDEGDEKEQLNPMDIMLKKKNERALLKHVKKLRKPSENLGSKVSAAQPLSDHVTGETLSVLEKKHDDAMNSFINSKLGNGNSSDQKPQKEMTKPSVLGTAELFNSIAKYAITKGTDAAGREISHLSNKEGDMGSGGNILGGTGIAEVSLKKNPLFPPGSVSTNEKGPMPRHDEDDMILRSGLPSSFRSSKRKKKTSTDIHYQTKDNTVAATIVSTEVSSMPSVDIKVQNKNIPSSFSHNYKRHTHDWVTKRRADEVKATEVAAAAVKDDDTSGRIGFTASRGTGYSRNNDSSDNRYKGKGKRTDDKVYRSFVNKQRERGF